MIVQSACDLDSGRVSTENEPETVEVGSWGMPKSARFGDT